MKEIKEKKYKNFIFDLDGTLLNTLEDLSDSVNYALDQFHYPKRTVDEIRRFVGNGVAKLVERALPEGKENKDYEKVLACFKEYYKEHMQSKTAPYEGIMETLKSLKEKGCNLAIVSNKFDGAVKELCKQYFSEYITVAIGESSLVAKKPAKDTAVQAMKELSASKEETVYIGDSDVDIMTAGNADIFCISVTWGFRDAAFLKENGAKLLIDSPSELLKFS